VTEASRWSYPGATARERPSAPSIIMAADGATLTYADLDRRSTALARVLRDAGLELGDHVALLMANDVRFLEVCWAALRSGLYCTPINPRSTPAEAEYLVRDSDAKVVIAAAEAAQRAVEVAASVGGVRVIAVDGASVGALDYEAALARTSGTRLPDETEGAMLLYSSGTTGRPKGIERPLSGRPPGSSNPLSLYMDKVRLDSSTVFYSPAPLYHAAPVGWSLGTHRVGGCVVLPERFDAEQMLAAIERYRVTHVQLVPTMMLRLIRLPPEVRERYDVSSVQRIIHAAAPCPAHVKHAMIEWFGPIVDEYYAGTEGTGATYVAAADWLARPGTVGRAVMGEIAIIGPDGERLPTGQIGTIYFAPASPYRLRNDPAATAARVRSDGWSTLDDVGRLDDDGYLYLTDRRTYMIVVGGVNVYPREVEDALLSHPSVADAAVIGVPDEEYGEQVKAVVALEPGVDAGQELAQELMAHCRRLLSTTKVPTSVDIVETLPRTETGKLRKGELREQYWAGHQSRIV
jgi:long-chain acyl-CoA synthetase